MGIMVSPKEGRERGTAPNLGPKVSSRIYSLINRPITDTIS